MAQTAEDSLPEGTISEKNSEILHRILIAVERKERKWWVEILCAIVLSLATLSSAWCTYQSTLWRSVQTIRTAASNSAARKSAAATVAAVQGRAFDASMFIQYLEAQSRKDEAMEKFLYSRFRPEMKKALDAWLKTDPLNNPSAPLSPFKMAEYSQPEMIEAARQDEQGSIQRSKIEEANTIANNYVLLTVRFASVLFLGGIAGMMQTRRLRLTVLLIALIIFTVTVVNLVTIPICTPGS